MRWMLCLGFAGLTACTSGPKTTDDTDTPEDTDSVDTDVAGDSDGTDDDTDAPDTDLTDTDAPSPDGPIGSCEFAVGYCQEYWSDVTTLGVYELTCGDNDGTWSDAACSHDGVVGGCRDTSSAWITITNWFRPASGYADEAAAQAACASSGGTYVAP